MLAKKLGSVVSFIAYVGTNLSFEFWRFPETFQIPKNFREFDLTNLLHRSSVEPRSKISEHPYLFDLAHNASVNRSLSVNC